MKKFKMVLLFALISALILVGGCRADVNKNQDNNTDTIVTNMVHGNPTGVWLMLSTGVSESLNKFYPGTSMEVTPGNNFSNLIRMEEFTAEFGLTHTTIAFEGSKGNGAFEKPLQNVGGVAVFYPSMGQFLISSEYGITEFDEFIEQKLPLKLAVGAENQVAEVTFGRLLSEYGLTFEDLEDWGCKLYTKNHKESIEMVSDDVLDAVWTVAGPPTPALVEMATNTDMILLDFSKEVIEKMHENYGYYEYNLGKGSYNFQTYDINGFSTFTMMAASLQTSEDTVYKVTKSICENIEYMSAIHSALEGLTKESLLFGMPIDLHPGAEKYYKEIGILD